MRSVEVAAADDPWWRPAATTPARRPWPHGLWLVGPLALAVSLTGLVVIARGDPRHIVTEQDLHVYYAYGKAVLHGADLYTTTPQRPMPFTYPPFAAYVLSALTLVPFAVAADVVFALSTAALVVVLGLVSGACGLRGTDRWGAATLAAAAALWLEPVQFTLCLGQINLLLLVLVAWDLTRRRGSPVCGVGVGLAAAIKLTPGLFVLYFLVSRQFRAFWTSLGTFAATVAAGWVLDPAASLAFWRGGFTGTGRIAGVTPLAFMANQSLEGFSVRILARDSGPSVTLLWLVLAVPVAVIGLDVARRAHRRGDELLAAGVVGILTVLVSPVSWSHHWVWILVTVPALVRAGLHRPWGGRPVGRTSIAVATVGVLALFATWPGQRLGHPQPTGLIWHQPWSPVPDGGRPEFRWDALQVVAGNAYVWFGLLVVGVAAALVRTGGTPAARRRLSALGRTIDRAGRP